ncbi:hypothetical protein GCM10017576_30640 [Microbacterium barkeri]|uniref:Uncharacterized protein n=1 Tax=Microbacterium barkeri TaxID=33917 RepID=A0A9W6H6E7_9MICO|nr:hypothetical protein GCM10017576_30640 [Microbacterium barkeri]
MAAARGKRRRSARGGDRERRSRRPGLRADERSASPVAGRAGRGYARTSARARHVDGVTPVWRRNARLKPSSDA